MHGFSGFWILFTATSDALTRSLAVRPWGKWSLVRPGQKPCFFFAPVQRNKILFRICFFVFYCLFVVVKVFSHSCLKFLFFIFFQFKVLFWVVKGSGDTSSLFRILGGSSCQ